MGVGAEEPGQGSLKRHKQANPHKAPVCPDHEMHDSEETHPGIKTMVHFNHGLHISDTSVSLECISFEFLEN